MYKFVYRGGGPTSTEYNRVMFAGMNRIPDDVSVENKAQFFTRIK